MEFQTKEDDEVCILWTYLLSFNRSTYDRPLSSHNSNIVAALHERQGLIYGIARNGSVQVMPMETVGEGSDVLHRTPVVITVVSSRGMGPECKKVQIKHISHIHKKVKYTAQNGAIGQICPF